jgi:uncharacterized protein YkwD
LSQFDLGVVLSPVTLTGAPSRRRILIVAVIAALAAVSSVVAPPGAHASTTPTYAEMMQRVVDDTNAIRTAAGLPSLVRNADLDRVAAAWARQQWENGAMSHNPNFSTQIPSGWQRAGENVAKGYTYLQVVPAWKASPGHYANIVNDYTSIGIGYFEQDGRRYWTQLFGKYPLAPVKTATPTVSGGTTIGSTWTLKPGTFTGSPSPTIKRAWLRCNQPVTTAFSSVPAGCVAISGASGASYVATLADAGKYLTALVTASNGVGTTRSGAATTVAITRPLAPASTASPTIKREWLRCMQRFAISVSTVAPGCLTVSGGTTPTISVVVPRRR